MSWEIAPSIALYLIVGVVVLRLGPWRDRIESELLRISLIATVPGSGEGDKPQILSWRVNLLGLLLWGAALTVWPFSLWSWGKKAWRAWSEWRKRKQRLWRTPGKVSTCPPRLAVEFWERRERTAIVGLEADDALAVLERLVAENPHLLKGEHGEALRWLKHRDKKAMGTMYRSTCWRPIETVAIELLKAGRCRVKCFACDKNYDGAEIKWEPWESWIPASETFNGGGNAGENFTCPKGHLLYENITAMA